MVLTKTSIAHLLDEERQRETVSDNSVHQIRWFAPYVLAVIAFYVCVDPPTVAGNAASTQAACLTAGYELGVLAPRAEGYES